jgi:hypothetical protein
MSKEKKTVCIATLSMEDESTLPLIRAELDKAHIAYQIRSHHDSAYNGLFLAQRGLADLFVYQQDKKRAEEIVKSLLK